MTNRGMCKCVGGAWLAVMALVGLFAGCHAESPASSDSETHFLATCTGSCSAGLTCLCGVCTKACSENAGCGELSSSASCAASCADSSSKTCDVSCSANADCASLGAEFGCDAGHCRQSSSEAGAGTGGGAGSHAGAGSGGAANGACHADPELAPSRPSATALDPDSVARAAAVIGSCLPDDGVARSATHLWSEHLAAPRFYFRFGEQLDCFADANCGCAAAERCASWVYSQLPAVCASTCQGDVFTGCGDGSQLSVDCSRLGLSCDSAANCVAEPAVSCAGSEPASCTAQGEVQFCDDGFVRKTPCQALGFSCVDGTCVGEGAACTESSNSLPELVAPVGTGCTGNHLQACLGGHTTSIDCATQGPGFACQAVEGSFFCGLAADCVPADNYLSAQPATCDGTTLSFCNAGRMEHLDCTALGFSGCEIDPKLDHYGCTPGAQLK